MTPLIIFAITRQEIGAQTFLTASTAGANQRTSKSNFLSPTIDNRPQSAAIKQVHTDKSTFTRFRAEASFRAPIVEVMKDSLAYFEADYRYHKELNASEASKQANLDKGEHFTAALILSSGVYVSYSTGKLPLDAKSDQVYELGFKFNF